jgi:uncharacterized protein YbjT (DUF2867 family)
VETLTRQGHVVRRIARSAGTSLDDAAIINAAFVGANGAFLMVPFDMSAPDLHRREFEIAHRLADAVAAGRVRRVVCLSGTSAHLAERAGSGRGASILAQQVSGLQVAERVYLRACFFMENLLQGASQIVKTGVFAWPFRPDIPTPMIAARDVGEEAAVLLTDDSFEQPLVKELLGPRDYTHGRGSGHRGVCYWESESEVCAGVV